MMMSSGTVIPTISSAVVIPTISSVVVILALTAIMVVVSAVTILHYKRKMQRILDAHSTPAPVYEVVAPLQIPTVAPLQMPTHMEAMEMEENACYAQNNIVPKDNVEYEKTRAEQVQDGEYY